MPFSLFINPSSPTLSPALLPYPHAALDHSSQRPNPLPKDSFHTSSCIPVRVCPSAPGCPLSTGSLNVVITGPACVAGFLACHSSPPPPSPARSGSRSLLGESDSDTVAEQHLPLRHMGLMRLLRPLVLSSRHFVSQRRISVSNQRACLKPVVIVLVFIGLFFMEDSLKRHTLSEQ